MAARRACTCSTMSATPTVCWCSTPSTTSLPPGTLRVFRDAEVPVWADTMMSLHQATFQELLSLARLRDRFPEKITLIGVQPDVLDDLGGSLSPAVRARLDEAVDLAVAELRAWGIEAVPRDAPPERGLEPRRAGAARLRSRAPVRARGLPHRRCALPAPDAWAAARRRADVHRPAAAGGRNRTATWPGARPMVTASSWT